LNASIAMPDNGRCDGIAEVRCSPFRTARPRLAETGR